jgi:hypothetical protein
MFQLKCVACIVEAKMAALMAPDGPVPPVRDAVAIVQAQTTCAEHIVGQQQSALSGPNGSALLVPR